MAAAGMVIEFEIFGKITADTERRSGQVVKDRVLDLEGNMKQEAPVLTGNLKNSIQGEMTGPLEGEVGVGAEYGPYVNMGTYKMAANPFFDRAIEAVTGPFQQAMGQVVEG